MGTIFNQSNVTGESAGAGVIRQRLLTPERVPGTVMLLDRIALDAGGEMRLTVPPTSVAWLQVLDGDLLLSRAGQRQTLTDTHVAFLPPGFDAGLGSEHGARVLIGEVPDAGKIDPGFAKAPLPFRLSDWTQEPVLDSRHDARKRIYLVTPKLFGTKAVKGEMIIYPPGTAAANHHHEGADHFMYVLRGRGTVYMNEQPFPVREGDVIYYPEFERHYLAADPNEELVFAEFFAPAEHTTVWVNPHEVCTWLPTGRDIRGRKPIREIEGHRSDQVASPRDV